MSDQQTPIYPLRQAAKGAIIYGVVAVLWITFSDTLLNQWIDDPQRLTELQTLKGWAFVVATSLALFAVMLHFQRVSAEHIRRYNSQNQQIHALSQFRESVIDNANIWINVLDPEANVTVWNKAAEQISGYRRDEVYGNPDLWKWLYPDPDYHQAVTATAAEILGQGAEVDGLETCIQARDGQEKFISWNSRRFFDRNGSMIGSIAIGLEVTESRQMRQLLENRERQLATLMGNLPGLAYRSRVTDQWTMVFVSSGCQSVTGYAPAELLGNGGQLYSEIFHSGDRAECVIAIEPAITANQPFELEYRIRRKDGKEIWVWEQARSMDVNGETFVEGIIMEITDRKLMEQQLAKLATRDSLTGLYNRRGLEDRFRHESARCQRYHRPLSVLMIDVDRFKPINDYHGHHVGDAVLYQMSRQLQKDVRKVDHVGRYGGEELVVLLPEMDAPEALEMAERIRHSIETNSFSFEGGEPIRITVSIGVASYPAHDDSPEHLVRSADRAMYQAKQAGRNCVREAAPPPDPPAN